MSLKPLIHKPPKHEREKKVLLGLIELYLEEGKPIGSNTLRSNGFKYLSSATIRNYFAKLETEGYLEQQHSSGGRVPTNKAYQLYASLLSKTEVSPKEEKLLKGALQKEMKEVVSYLHQAAETLSELSGCPVFLLTPRLDMDLIQSIRFIPFDNERLLCAISTDFGLLRTEILHLPVSFSEADARGLEDYFYWRLSKRDKPNFTNETLKKWAQRIYNEIMVRHVAGFSQAVPEEIYRTGLSKLLHFPEFADPTHLANNLALFEDLMQMNAILIHCMKKNSLSTWIGEELHAVQPKISGSAVLAIPYRIGKITVGAFGILGPCRLPYRKLFGLLHRLSEYVSEALSNSVCKFQIPFHPLQEGQNQNSKGRSILLEDQSKLGDPHVRK